MTERSLSHLRRAYDRGEIARDDYWLAAQREYRRLGKDTPLPADGPVTAIEERDGALVVVLRDGLRMLWNPEDLRTAPNMLLNHGVYEAQELALLEDISQEATVVFDVGANVGWYTLHFARWLAATGGRVYAFEPIPRTFATLQRNVMLNDLHRSVSLYPLGLGDRRAEVEFFIPDVTGSVAASQRPLFEQQKNDTVRASIARLDDVVAELDIDRLHLIKCDIEGGELQMLHGGIETIRKFRPVLFLELLRKWSKAYGYHPNDVIDLLDAEGYLSFAITGEGLAPMSRVDEAVTATNFLFIHNESMTLQENRGD